MPITEIIRLASIAAGLAQQITAIINKVDDLDGKSQQEAKAALAQLSAATDDLYNTVQLKLKQAAGG